MIKYIKFKNFNKKNPRIRYFVTMEETTYIFRVNWDSEYGDCGYLTITDYNNNPIISGVALVNGLKIRNNKLPYTMFLVQKNGETYEPTIDNIENEFVLGYEVANE